MAESGHQTKDDRRALARASSEMTGFEMLCSKYNAPKDYVKTGTHLNSTSVRLSDDNDESQSGSSCGITEQLNMINQEKGEEAGSTMELFRSEPLLPHTKSSTLNINSQTAPEYQLLSLDQIGFNSMEHKFVADKPPPKRELYSLIRALFENRIKPNFTVNIGDKSFLVHLDVLQSYSKMFVDFSTEVSINLPKERVTPLAFNIIYDWMIGDQPMLQRAGLLEVLNAATFLGVQQLVSQCWACLDSACLKEDKAFLLYLESKTNDLGTCHLPMLTRISKFFLYLVASKEFLELRPDEIHTIFSSNRIAVNSELEIFMAAVRWLNYDWKERKKHAISLMHCVRFGLIPPWMLTEIQKKETSSDVHRVIAILDVRDQIRDGMCYTSTRLFFASQKNNFIDYIQENKLCPPKMRTWIYDHSCAHHHRIQCPNARGFTYQSFLSYLQMFLKKDPLYWQSFEPANDGLCRCGAQILKVEQPDHELLWNGAESDKVLNGNVSLDSSDGLYNTKTSAADTNVDRTSAFLSAQNR